MRVIAGNLGGRLLAGPRTSTRPMTDKVKAAMFDILGPIDDFAVLDAYAGTGALGIEALSRGAGSVIGIEADREAAKNIRRNIAKLGLEDKYELVIGRVESWINSSSGQFDLIIADPPYKTLDQLIINELATRLTEGGVMVLSHSIKTAIELEPIESRTYGDTSLSFFKAD